MYNKWVALWGNSLSYDEFRPSNYAKDITLRYVITALIPGEKIRLKFSNTYGYENVRMTSVTVCTVDAEGNAENIKQVTFNRNKSVVMCKGGSIYSDEIDISLYSGQKLAVSMYFEDYTDMHTAVKTTGPLTDGTFAKGDFSFASVIPKSLSDATNIAYFLDTVEVLTCTENKAAVVFGDSISAQSWPEWLALRLLDEGRSDISVVRRAVSGSRVLREYSNLSLLKYAHSGVSRFEDDISSVKGADRVFVLHGINDIIHPKDGALFRPMTDLPTAEDLIDGYKKYIKTAHSYGIKIYFATITPFAGIEVYSDNRNSIREDINLWIRTNTEADGFIDFAGAVCDKDTPNALSREYDSGDHLHPSLAGGKKLADSIPSEFLK